MSVGFLATAILSAAAVMAQNSTGGSVSQTGVVATFPNGVTNPAAPAFAEVGSTVNQTSYSRLLSLNGVNDFCVFGPPEAGPDSLIGNVSPADVVSGEGARMVDADYACTYLIRSNLSSSLTARKPGTEPVSFLMAPSSLRTLSRRRCTFRFKVSIATGCSWPAQKKLTFSANF